MRFLQRLTHHKHLDQIRLEMHSPGYLTDLLLNFPDLQYFVKRVYIRLLVLPETEHFDHFIVRKLLKQTKQVKK